MRILLIVSINIILFTSLSIAKIIYIPKEYPTIQAGIDSSFDGDTVLVDEGTYYENINFNGKNIILGSLFFSTGDKEYIIHTVIDGNQKGSVVTFESGEDSTATLIGFTITNGASSRSGQALGPGIFLD